MKRIVVRTLGIQSIIASALILSACTSNKQPLSSDSGSTPTIGQSFFSLPLYPGSTENRSMDMSNKKSGTATVVLQTDDGTEQVSQYYQDQLKRSGWKLAGVMQIDRMSTIEAQKNSSSASVVIAGVPGGKTTITLSTMMM